MRKTTNRNETNAPPVATSAPSEPGPNAVIVKIGFLRHRNFRSILNMKPEDLSKLNVNAGVIYIAAADRNTRLTQPPPVSPECLS